MSWNSTAVSTDMSTETFQHDALTINNVSLEGDVSIQLINLLIVSIDDFLQIADLFAQLLCIVIIKLTDVVLMTTDRLVKTTQSNLDSRFGTASMSRHDEDEVEERKH